jgi:hypothetical protein
VKEGEKVCRIFLSQKCEEYEKLVDQGSIREEKPRFYQASRIAAQVPDQRPIDKRRVPQNHSVGCRVVHREWWKKGAGSRERPIQEDVPSWWNQ